MWYIHRQTPIDSPLFHPPRLPRQQVLPKTTPAEKLFEKSVSLRPQCRSLGSVSGWPAQWKTLLAFTYDVNTRCRAPPPVMTVPLTGAIIHTWRGKTRAWAVPPHKVKLKAAITSFPSFEQTKLCSNYWCWGHIPFGCSKLFPYGILDSLRISNAGVVWGSLEGSWTGVQQVTLSIIVYSFKMCERHIDPSPIENKKWFIHPPLPNQEQSFHTAKQVPAWQEGCEGVEAASSINLTYFPPVQQPIILHVSSFTLGTTSLKLTPMDPGDGPRRPHNL